jgi:DNA-3-methyladenine glycosylase
MLLPEGFYRRKEVTRIARELLGKALFTRIHGKVTGGLIVEAEAYSWRERGCHAFNNRRTKRNEVMYGDGGNAYVYLCYGIHNLFNVVTNQAGTADAVLIRALQPVDGVTEMLNRTGHRNSNRITSGPGKLTKALGIERTHNGKALSSKSLWIADVGYKLGKGQIIADKRIGIDYAGEDAKLPWRFTVKNNEWVSV